MVNNLKPLKIVKACTTRWLTHGEKSARVIGRFKQVIATLDTLTKEKHDEYTKDIKDQMLFLVSILMLFLRAEVQVYFLSFFSNKTFELQLENFKVSTGRNEIA